MTALTLVRNETIKTTRRPAFWVSLLGFAAIMSIAMLERQTGDAPPVGFPDVWSGIIGNIGPVAPFFAAILVILLVTGEFSFRTARQNVIDGLSKDAWFAGKMLLVPGVALAFLALMFGIAAIGALKGSITEAVVRSGDLAVMGGYSLGVLVLVTGAFMAAMLVRGSGSAMAAFFFYLTLLERLFAQIVGRFSPETRPALEYLPFTSAMRLMEPAQFDPSIVTRAAARAAEAGTPYQTPELVDSAILTTMGGVYIIAFVAIAYVVFRKRDL